MTKKISPSEILGGEKKKPTTKKKNRPTETRVKHHKNGSHTIEHSFAPSASGELTPEPITYAAQDLDGVHDGLEEHVGEPNEGEEASQPAPSAAPPSAQEA